MTILSVWTCKECMNIYSLTLSPPPHHHPLPLIFTILYIFCSLSLSYLFHLLHLPPSTTCSLQSKQSSSYSDRDTTEDDSESLEDMDFLSRQKKLQAEAKLALAMAKPMAKMQVEVEKQNRKKSPVADLVSTWITQKYRFWLSFSPEKGKNLAYFLYDSNSLVTFQNSGKREFYFKKFKKKSETWRQNIRVIHWKKGIHWFVIWKRKWRVTPHKDKGIFAVLRFCFCFYINNKKDFQRELQITQLCCSPQPC